MPHPLHGIFDGLPVVDFGVCQLHLQRKPLGNQAFEDFLLDFSHDLGVNLPTFPQDVKLGVLLFQLPQLGKDGHGVGTGGQGNPVGHDRLHQGRLPFRLCPQGLANPGLGQTGGGADLPREHLRHRREFLPGVNPQLLDFLLYLIPLCRFIGKGGADGQRPAGDLQPGQAVALGVPGDFVDFCSKFLPVLFPRGVGGKQLQKGVHSLEFQTGAEAAGKELSVGYELPEVPFRDGSRFQVGFQQGLVAQSGVFPDGFLGLGEVHKAGTEGFLQFLHQLLPALPRQIHFVQKQEGGHGVPPQKLPQGDGVSLHPVGAADDQHGAAEHRHDPLRLRGKVHVPRGVQQGDMLLRQLGLLGEDGNAPGPLQVVGVQIGIPVVHPPQSPPHPRHIQKGLRQGGLSRIHMGQKPYGGGNFVFHTMSSPFLQNIREALNKLARAGSVRFFVRQKNGKQWNTVCISCFSFCVDGEKDKLSSRRRFIQSFHKGIIPRKSGESR